LPVVVVVWVGLTALAVLAAEPMEQMEQQVGLQELTAKVVHNPQVVSVAIIPVTINLQEMVLSDKAVMPVRRILIAPAVAAVAVTTVAAAVT
jgi:hypothetical protein